MSCHVKKKGKFLFYFISFRFVAFYFFISNRTHSILIHFFIHSFIHSFNHSFIHSFIHSSTSLYSIPLRSVPFRIIPLCSVAFHFHSAPFPSGWLQSIKSCFFICCLLCQFDHSFIDSSFIAFRRLAHSLIRSLKLQSFTHGFLHYPLIEAGMLFKPLVSSSTFFLFETFAPTRLRIIIQN